MDRGELFSLVADETHRPDLAADFPDFLALVEAKIARELRCVEMEAEASMTFTSGVAALPADFLGPRALYDSTGPLQQVGLMEYRTCQNQERTFAVTKAEVLARVDAATLDYFARPVAMASDSDTTAVLDAHPDLYVGLMSFYVYRRTQDLELAQTALASYEDARDTLNQLADRQRGAARLGKPYAFQSSASY